MGLRHGGAYICVFPLPVSLNSSTVLAIFARHNNVLDLHLHHADDVGAHTFFHHLRLIGTELK